MDIQSLIRSLEHAENDNRKFALLLILSELIKTNKLNELKQNTEESKKLNERLFNSIGTHFLARLISTKQVADNCSPLMFKSIGFSILTQFLEYPKLICDPILLSKIDIICDALLLKQSDPNDEIEKNLVLDVFKYLFALSSQCGDYLICNSGLIELLMEKIILNEQYDKENRYKYELKQLDENDLDYLACKLFIKLCSESIKTEVRKDHADLIPQKINNCIQSLLSAINANQNRFKFSLINYLIQYFLDENNNLREYFTNECASDLLFNVLNDLFKSKLSRVYKVLAFKLLEKFVKLYQFEYIYLKNRSFFYLIIHLLCIEIGYSLEEATQAATTKNERINQNLIERITIYYGLFEEIIIILSTASPFDDNENDLTDSDNEDIDEAEATSLSKEKEPELENAIKIIVETLEAIIMFVKDALDDMTQLKEDDELLLQVASIRVLISWLAHETLLEEKLIDLMPKFIKFADYYKTNQINLFHFLKPGLERYLIDLKDRQDFLKSNQSNQHHQADLVKLEFEKCEINEKINNINDMLNKCKINL